MRPITFTALFLFLSTLILAEKPSSEAMTFLENKGQIRTTEGTTNDEVKFLWSSRLGLNVQFTDEGLAFDTYQRCKADGSFQFHRLDMNFVGANEESQLLARSRTDEKVNYINGDDFQSIRSYEKLIYKNIYDQIDVIARSGSANLKYDFVLKEGADINDIVLEYAGFDSYSLGSNAISFLLSGKKITEHIPKSWLSETGEEIRVDYRIIDENDNSIRLGFEVCDDNYVGKRMIIDPEVVPEWSTYHGDSLYDTANDIVTDVWGFVFIAGTTESLETIASAGGYQNTYAGGETDAFLTRMNQHGLRQWSTYYGGSGADSTLALCMNDYHRIYLVGKTTSTDSIANENSQQLENAGGNDGFIAAFGRLGNFLWDTYLGGVNDDEICDCFAFQDGRVTVLGTTESEELFSSHGILPVQPYANSKDVFAASFSAGGNLLHGTFAGGEGDDLASAIEVSDSGYIYMAANTNSATGIATNDAAFPNLSGLSDGMIIKSDTLFNNLWSTYFGGEGSDFITDIDVIADTGLFYVGGYTDSVIDLAVDTISAQTESGGLEDGFIAKLGENGFHEWFTYSGGPGNDRIVSIQLDIDSSLYAVGVTTSDTGIVFFDEDSVPSSYAGEVDSYLARYDEEGPRIYTHYIGGEGSDQAQSIAVYGRTAFFVVGSTNSETDMVLTSEWQPSAHQNSYKGGGADAFFARFTGLYSTPPPDCEDCPWDGGGGGGPGGGGGGGGGPITEPSGPPAVCLGDSILIDVVGGALGQNALWIWYEDSCGAEDILGEGWSIWVKPDTTTTYWVRSEGAGRVSSCTSRKVIVEEPFDMTASVTDSICAGEPIVFTADSAITYEWTGPDTLAFEGSPYTLDSAWNYHIGWYYVTGTGLACTDTDSVQVSVIYPEPSVEAVLFNPTCVGTEDGSITIVELDQSIIEFEWTNIIDSTLTRDSLPDGFYPYFSENIYGCTSSSGFSLEEPVNPFMDFEVVSDTCDQSVGSAIALLSQGWMADFDLAWSTGLDSNVVNAQNLVQGEYFVVAYNEFGCTFEDSVTIGNFGEFTTSISEDSLFLEFLQTATVEVLNSPAQAGETYLWTPQFGLSCADCSTPIVNPDSTTLYLLATTSALGCTATDSLYVEREVPPPTSFIPTVFSPNNDGLNDQLCVMGNRILEVDFAVFNRWGEEVFATSETESCWDGTHNGQPVSGALIYTLKAVLEEGKTVEESGNIQILR